MKRVIVTVVLAGAGVIAVIVLWVVPGLRSGGGPTPTALRRMARAPVAVPAAPGTGGLGRKPPPIPDGQPMRRGRVLSV